MDLNIESELKKAIESGTKRLEKDESFKKQVEFYAEMKKNGLISPQKYSISKLDTVGKRLYQSMENKG